MTTTDPKTTVQCGSCNYEVTVTDTSIDGVREAQGKAHMHTAFAHGGKLVKGRVVEATHETN